jgi:hypothetical protein
MAGGRPTKYDERYAEEGRRLALLGATDVEMSEFWGVTEKTLNNWKSAHPGFLQALKDGKAMADGKVVESLYRRALGYSHDAVKILQYEGNPIEVPYTEHYAPDTTACIFWLKNRQREKWRDKTDHEHSGTVGVVELIEQVAAERQKTAK